LYTRNSKLLGTAAILFAVLSVSLPVHAAPVYIYGGDFDLPIPANPDDTQGWMEDAVIEIPDHHTIIDLDVRISSTHTSIFDLQLFLQSPGGTILCLNMYDFDEYIEGENYEQTIFDDEAQVAIEDGEPPFTGRFRPKAIDPFNLLELFDGQDTFGQWHLRIYDAYYNDTGTLNSFELIITTPEPASAILLTLGTVLITLLKPRRMR